MKVYKVIDIKFTYNCNNRCFLCCQDEIHKNNRADIRLSDFEHILDANENKEYTRIVLTGGEATNHPEFLTLLRAIQRYGYKEIQLQTNARRLSDESFLEQVILNGVNSFGISLHGSKPEIHNRFTMTESFNQVIKALKNIKKYRESVSVGINSVIFDGNMDDLTNINDLLNSEDLCDNHKLSYVHIIGNAVNNLNNIITLSEAAEAVRPVLQRADECNASLNTEAIPFCLMYGYEKYVGELISGKLQAMVINRNQIIDFTALIKSSLKSKMRCCGDCFYNTLCDGVWSEYLDFFGDREFKPVKKLSASLINNIKARL